MKKHFSKTIVFAASDAPLKPAESDAAPNTLHIPEAIGAVTIVYNLPEMKQSGLKLTGTVIADIFLGKITKFNDPAIQELNPEVSLPDEDIVETEEELLARAVRLHADQEFPTMDELTNKTSLFRNPDRKNANL